MSRPNPKALTLLALALAVSATPAFASAGDVIRDCSEDGVLNRHYSQSELTGALDKLPSDLDEYTDCRSVIRRAQLAGARGKKKQRPGILGRVDRAKPPSANEQESIDQAARSHGAVHVGGKPIEPGEAGTRFHTSGLGTKMPTFVLLTLIALGSATLWASGFAARRRWPNAWRAAENGVRRGIARFRR
jgi:hypothetical protein